MSYQNFLNDTCDIFHIVKSDRNFGYGLQKQENSKFGYSSEPDIEGQACHFGVKSRSSAVLQQAPKNDLEEKIKLYLPWGTDIRVNDKIIDRRTKYEYTAEQPVPVQKHHIFVWIKRTEAQKPL